MSKIESVFLSIVLGLIPPLVGFLALWWASFAWAPDAWVSVLAIAGLLAGVAVDVLWLRTWVRRAYYLDVTIWMAIYVFYSVATLGLFMGVPVFNVALALPAGFLMAGRLARSGADAFARQRATRGACGFTTGVLAVACAASAALALTDPYTAANLEGMLGLGFSITRPMIVGIIAVGGAVLLALQWWLTAQATRISANLIRRLR